MVRLKNVGLGKVEDRKWKVVLVSNCNFMWKRLGWKKVRLGKVEVRKLKVILGTIVTFNSNNNNQLPLTLI